MDQYLSAVIISIITGVFSILTIVIKKRNDSVMLKIDEKSKIIVAEKKLKQDLAVKEKELQTFIYRMTILIMDTNIQIMSNVPQGAPLNIDEYRNQAKEIKKAYEKTMEEIDDLNLQYEMIQQLSASGGAPTESK